MKREPTEFGLAADVAKTQSRRLSQTHKPVSRDEPLADEWTQSVQAIDEAFAELNDHLSRLELDDIAHRQSVRDGVAQTTAEETGETARIDNRTVVANLNSQRISLDQQCEQLSELLRSIETDPLGG